MVHIVYCTTNIINKKIYIGVHQTENPDKFDGYLGNALWVNDVYYLNSPKEPFHYAVKKYGVKNFIRKTLKVFDNRKDALAMEAEIVNEEFIRRADTYNITLGGGDPPRACKTIYQYSLDGTFIKEWSSIREAAHYYGCVDSSIGHAIFDRTPSKGFLWSEAKSDKLDLDVFHLNENLVKTYLYDIEGNLILEFISISECARYLGETPAYIQKGIKGKRKLRKKWYVSDVRYDIFPIPKQISRRNQPVYQYTIDGEFIIEWKCPSEICKTFKVKNAASAINTSIKLGHSWHGFQWSYERVPYMKKLKSTSGRVRKVGRYSSEGELLEAFKSVNDAKRAWGSSAVGCLRGTHKTCKGFIFKYID